MSARRRQRWKGITGNRHFDAGIFQGRNQARGQDAMHAGSSSSLGCAAPLHHLHLTVGVARSEVVNTDLNHLRRLATIPPDEETP